MAEINVRSSYIEFRDPEEGQLIQFWVKVRLGCHRIQKASQ